MIPFKVLTILTEVSLFQLIAYLVLYKSKKGQILAFQNFQIIAEAISLSLVSKTFCKLCQSLFEQYDKMFKEFLVHFLFYFSNLIWFLLTNGI